MEKEKKENTRITREGDIRCKQKSERGKHEDEKEKVSRRRMRSKRKGLAED